MNKIFIKKFQKYKKSIEYRYKRLKIIFLIFILLFGYTIYSNFDYLLFKTLIAGNYIYTDTLDEIYYEELNKKDIKNYFRNFDKMVISVVIDRIKAENNDRYTMIYSPKQYSNYKENVKNVSRRCEIKELRKDVVYIEISNFSTYSKKFVYSNKQRLKEFENIIIDLRDNRGGSLSSAYKIIDLFIPNNTIIGYENARSNLFSSKIKTKLNQFLEYNNIFILQNENTASSAEIFINALKYNLNNVTLIGKRTFGKGIGQIEFYLKDGYVLKATTLNLETPINTSINKIGIIPDIEYNDDDIIDYILSLIK